MKKFFMMATFALFLCACGNTADNANTAVSTDSIAEMDTVSAASTDVIPEAAPGDSGKVAQK